MRATTRIARADDDRRVRIRLARRLLTDAIAVVSRTRVATRRHPTRAGTTTGVAVAGIADAGLARTVAIAVVATRRLPRATTDRRRARITTRRLPHGATTVVTTRRKRLGDAGA